MKASAQPNPRHCSPITGAILSPQFHIFWLEKFITACENDCDVVTELFWL